MGSPHYVRATSDDEVLPDRGRVEAPTPHTAPAHATYAPLVTHAVQPCYAESVAVGWPVCNADSHPAEYRTIEYVHCTSKTSNAAFNATGSPSGCERRASACQTATGGSSSRSKHSSRVVKAGAAPGAGGGGRWPACGRRVTLGVGQHSVSVARTRAAARERMRTVWQEALAMSNVSRNGQRSAHLSTTRSVGDREALEGYPRFLEGAARARWW